MKSETQTKIERPAVFMDRDGTINEQMGYINHLSRFILLPGVAEAIRLLNQSGYFTIVVSNQSGVAQGYFPLELVEQVHARMEALLREQGAHVDGVFFCPHHPSGIVPEYRVTCDCRKPKTGLVQKACEAFPISISKSYVIGDRLTDILLGHRLGLKGILVKTGYGLGEVQYVLPHVQTRPSHVARDLLSGVHWILEDAERTRSTRGMERSD